MGLTIVTQPTSEPVTLAEAVAYLKAQGSGEDELISSLIKTARELAEAATDRAFITTRFKDTRDDFSGCLKLTRSKVSQIVSIKYYDTAGVLQTVDSSVYESDLTKEPCEIVLRNGKSWPTPDLRVGAVEITYDAGYGTSSSDVPAPIRTAILILVAHLYENRGETITGVSISKIPMASEYVLSPFRVMELY